MAIHNLGLSPTSAPPLSFTDYSSRPRAFVNGVFLRFFSELLSTAGPLHKDSAPIQRELALLPAALDLCGTDDLVALLCRSIQFAVVSGFLCLTTDARRAMDLWHQQQVGAAWRQRRAAARSGAHRRATRENAEPFVNPPVSRARASEASSGCLANDNLR